MDGGPESDAPGKQKGMTVHRERARHLKSNASELILSVTDQFKVREHRSKTQFLRMLARDRCLSSAPLAISLECVLTCFSSLHA
jgi:hypothetical protein